MNTASLMVSSTFLRSGARQVWSPIIYYYTLFHIFLKVIHMIEAPAGTKTEAKCNKSKEKHVFVVLRRQRGGIEIWMFLCTQDPQLLDPSSDRLSGRSRIKSG